MYTYENFRQIIIVNILVIGIFVFYFYHFEVRMYNTYQVQEAESYLNRAVNFTSTKNSEENTSLPPTTVSTTAILPKNLQNSSSFVKEILTNFSKSPIHSMLITDVEESFIKLQYPQFKLTVPNFISDEQRQLHLKTSTMNLTYATPEQELVGIIGFHKVDHFNSMKKKGCGSRKYKDMKLRKGGKFPVKDEVDMILLLLHVPEGHTFQHFLDGTLPKLMQVLPLLAFPNVRVILNFPPGNPLIKDILKEWSVKIFHGIHHTAKGGEGLHLLMKKAKRKHTLLVDTCVTPPMHPLLWQMARQVIGVNEHLKQEVTSSKQEVTTQSYVVLISREISQNRGRKLLNFELVKKYLSKRYGSERVKVWKGGTGLKNVTALFGKISILIGVHGAGLYNSFFCPVETHVVELVPLQKKGKIPRGLAPNIFWMMTSLVGQPYWRVYVNATGKSNDVDLPIKTLISVLDHIDQESTKVNR